MSLVKWKKEDELFPSLSSFFDDLWGRDFVSGVQTGTSVPAVNITETSENFDIEVAAPGMKKEDFKIDLDNGMLVISLKRKKRKRQLKRRLHVKSLVFRHFNVLFQYQILYQ
ncbi:Hsp20 family protein [Flavivirga amylovorans]|uniref:Hsp20 family protein n=1 Tax=Flavivirga amylovorans TaxID=870486 RepID=A0ABT8X789_9FLAO|nr:Hsp20 family protein [Flavivirga amylovorans]MDO5989780.1 Hsp20 family protein [Flavivirga amylovorans]